MVKKKKYLIVFISLFCLFGCSTKTSDKTTLLEKNINENLTHIEESIYTEESVSDMLDIAEQLYPILNIFGRNEDIFKVWQERTAIATSLVLDYIKEKGGLTIDVIESIPTIELPEPYIHISPDDLLHIHRWTVFYAENAGLKDYQSLRYYYGYEHLYITIIQYETVTGELITIPFENILNLLDISNRKFLNGIWDQMGSMGDYTVKLLNDSVYLFCLEFGFDDYPRNYPSINNDRIGYIFFAVKYEENEFALQKIFNDEMFLILFMDIGRLDEFKLNGFKIDSEYILFNKQKQLPYIDGWGDMGVYTDEEIKFIYNGSEFIGDYKQLFELSNSSAPENFSIYNNE
jgi:hypothetical protein